ncbi:MAG: hypothetical protein IJ593_09420 [Lachnospiraceae bacterium]|nr:hypothetical protein [Lachnospiraceae bacterium]
MFQAKFLDYDKFKSINDDSKKCFSGAAKIGMVDLKNGVLELTYMGNTSTMAIDTLVRNIVLDGLGVVSNPSALRNWTGFKNIRIG